jgi:cell division protein FtsB
MRLSEIENQYKNRVDQTEVDKIVAIDEIEIKNKIWNAVTYQLPDRKRLLFNRILAVASVLFFLFSLFVYQHIHEKNAIISSLKVELNKLETEKEQLDMQVAEIEMKYYLLENKPALIDTVYQTEIVYQMQEITGTICLDEAYEQENLYSENGEQLIMLGDDMLDLANVHDDIESFKIKCEKKTKEGTTPWSFEIVYN